MKGNQKQLYGSSSTKPRNFSDFHKNTENIFFPDIVLWFKQEIIFII